MKHTTTFSLYTLLKLEPKLASIRAMGTDGEQALTKAIQALFPQDIVLLRCYLHMKDNIRRKLTDLLFPEEIFLVHSTEVCILKVFLILKVLMISIVGLCS